MKRTVSIDGWTITLRVRVQRKKRIKKGRVRGRYEGKTAHVVVQAPNREKREYYLGSGDSHKRERDRPDPGGEEKRRGARAGELEKSGGGNTGTKARLSAIDTRDASDDRTLPMFSEGESWAAPGLGFMRRKR